jgi:hypothetical protein
MNMNNIVLPSTIEELRKVKDGCHSIAPLKLEKYDFFGVKW